MEKRRIKDNGIVLYTLLFIAVSVVVFLPFILRGLTTVWKIDGVGQYYPAFLYIGQYLRELFSSFSLRSFDLRIAMGEDVFSALNYYGLGDPLNLIAIFANKTNGVYLFAFMFFLRLYLSGLSFYLYCSYMKLNKKLIVPGAFMYMCSGYVFCACMMYIEFLSPLIYFPLLLWAIEKFLKERAWWWLIPVSAYGALCTMYLFYYAALFLVPYAIVRTLAVYDTGVLKERIIKALRDCIVCGASCVGGILITFPILYPALKGMLISKRQSGDILGVFTTLTNYRPRRYNTVQFFKGFLPTYDEGVYFFHEIPVISYIAIVLLFVSYFILKNKTKRNRQLLIAVIMGCVLFTMPITNIVFSGFVPGFSYDRWIFMLEFAFAIVFICVMDDFIKWYADKNKIDNVMEKDGGSEFSGDAKAADGALTLNLNRIYTAVTALVIINVSVIGLVLYAWAGKEFTDAFLTKEEVSKCVDSPVNYSEVIKSDSGLYRVSHDSLTNVNGRPENVQMINDYNGLTFWFSIVNPNMQSIADELKELNSHGFVDQRMFGLENSKVAESLAGVKYYLRHDNETFPSEYNKVETIDFYGENWEIYENPDALPLCFGYSSDFYNNRLKKCYYDDDDEAISEAVPAENVVYDKNIITCDITMEEDGYVMVSIPYSDGFSVTIDDIAESVYNSDIYYMSVPVKSGTHKLIFKYSSYR